MNTEVKELTEGMQRLCAVANRIVSQQGTVSRIEIDLLLEDLRRLYDVALRLGGDPTTASPVRSEEPETTVEEHSDDQHRMAMMSTMAAMGSPMQEEPKVDQPLPPVEEKKAEPEIQKETEVAMPAEEQKPMPRMEELENNDNALLFDEIIIEPEIPVAPEPVKAKAETKQKAVKPQPPQEPTHAPTPAAEPIEPTPEQKPDAPAHANKEGKNVQSSLLDYLQNSNQRTLGEQLAAQHPLQNNLERKVDDLRTVININDRFSFMNELFHNNIKAYNDFILALNAIENRDEAMALVSEVALQQKWDNESATVITFHKILDKKF